jgi:hypothetical protein
LTSLLNHGKFEKSGFLSAMSKSTSILAGLCIVTLGFSGYEGYRVREAVEQLNAAREESAKQEKEAAAVQIQFRGLQTQVEILIAKTDNFSKFLDQINQLAGADHLGGSGTALVAQLEQATKPDNGPPPANEVKAERALTPLSPEELAQRIDVALQRTPETLTPVSTQDLTNMPSSYEWGSGSDRRMWRMIDQNTYYEVYPDGSYSVFPVLGRATVNDIPGVITTKDDGSLDVFIPDKGGRMVHLLRGASPGSQWSDYQDMHNVE